MLDVLCLFWVVGNLGEFAAGGPCAVEPGGWKTGACTDRLLGARLVIEVLAGWNKPAQEAGGQRETSCAKFAVEPSVEYDLKEESIPEGRTGSAEILPVGWKMGASEFSGVAVKLLVSFIIHSWQNQGLLRQLDFIPLLFVHFL